jgi:hypothetical protein
MFFRLRTTGQKPKIGNRKADYTPETRRNLNVGAFRILANQRDGRHQPIQVPFRRTIGDDHRKVWIVARELGRAMVPDTTTNVSGRPATRQINRAADAL